MIHYSTIFIMIVLIVNDYYNNDYNIYIYNSMIDSNDKQLILYYN